MIERTISIIKPNAVASNNIGDIISIFESNGLTPVAMKLINVTESMAENFYIEHKERPFYKNLVEFMSSGPVVVMALEGENAIKANRDLMGDKDPKLADPDSIRAKFGESIDANAVHGSDSTESATRELKFFFGDGEFCPRA